MDHLPALYAYEAAYRRTMLTDEFARAQRRSSAGTGRRRPLWAARRRLTTRAA